MSVFWLSSSTSPAVEDVALTEVDGALGVDEPGEDPVEPEFAPVDADDSDVEEPDSVSAHATPCPSRYGSSDPQSYSQSADATNVCRCTHCFSLD